MEKRVTTIKQIILLTGTMGLVACGTGLEDELVQAQNQLAPQNNEDVQTIVEANNDTALDVRLRNVLADENINGNPAEGLDIPSIDDPVSQLGMKLFYSKSLGGEIDSACVTCHHPSLGGTDNLSLSVGVEALDVDLLGPGRRHISGTFPVPRNAPTTFNSALYRESLFWDSRVRQLDSGIETPDSGFNTPDQKWIL